MTAGLVGALWLPGVAAAEVRTVPTEARQGDAVRLEFVVTGERPGVPTREVEIRLPTDVPIAEVHPMSVPDWAPRISYRTLDRPVAGAHGVRVGTVTSAVTWTRAAGGSAGPVRLALSMGPLPAADRLVFEVRQTYADGTVARWGGSADGAPTGPAPTLALRPAADAGRSPGAAGTAGGHGSAGRHGTAGTAGPVGAAGPGGTAGTPTGRDEATTATPAGTGSNGLLAAGLLAGVGFGVLGGWLGARWRRLLPEGPADPDPTVTTSVPAPTVPATAPDPTVTATGPVGLM
ncbi:DUF1775 domain-containing protein [Micromonospora sp. WMMD882]|uniref:DUF1775 domain-containing protein n=1 Tax=Micromonospora sp. WMMD882 TaxID=3015151 RepID=UPI00248C19F2|nr:DUF1775 domain-containing protein [Micromonospora sp. WMMD882]WBB81436.1 DUF1775 domain-containing protein [Micromonospora sp. WMMD882]